MSKKSKLTLVGGGTDKEKALDIALKQIERAFGKGAIIQRDNGQHMFDVYGGQPALSP